jgi:hypothetical protein
LVPFSTGSLTWARKLMSRINGKNLEQSRRAWQNMVFTKTDTEHIASGSVFVTERIELQTPNTNLQGITEFLIISEIKLDEPVTPHRAILCETVAEKPSVKTRFRTYIRRAVVSNLCLDSGQVSHCFLQSILCQLLGQYLI